MGLLGLFGIGGKERVRLTLVKAQEMERHATTVIHELRSIEYALEEMRKDLPASAPGDGMRGLQHTMEVSERHIEQLEAHLKRVKDHTQTLKEHIAHAKQR